MAGPVRVEHVTTAGTFALDGGEWAVENNIWIVGDDSEVLVVDAAHTAAPVLDAIGGRRVVAVACTHGHNDHINAAWDLADGAGGAPVLLHPDDHVLWDTVYPGRRPDRALADGDVLVIAGAEVHVLHTPGHSPGGVCLAVPDLGVVFSGDTLFQGGPGATGRSHSDFATIIDSIVKRILTLPGETGVHTGHGPSTTVAAEAPHLEEWVARGR